MKRILSLILASVMVLSLIPCVFAEETELEVKYNFDFGAAGYGSTAEVGLDALKTYGDLTVTSQDSKEGHTWAGNEKNGFWLVDGHRNAVDIALTGDSASDKKKPDSLYFYMYGTRVWTKNSETNKFEKLTNGALAIRLQIDEPGTYIPELTYYPRNDLAIYDVYLVSLKTSQYYLQASDRNRLKFNNSGITGTVYTVVKSFSNTYLGQIDMYDTNLDVKTARLNAYTVSESEAKYSQFALLLYPNGMNPALISEYADKNGPTQYLNIDSFRLLGEKKEEATLDSELTYVENAHVGGGTSLRAFAVYGTDGTVSETEIIETPDVKYGETAKVNAPESLTKGDDTYNFLYWAKGATMERKKIISHSAEFSYKPQEGANYLLAVYEKADNESSEKKEYYNANGELLANGDTLPSMAGYGKAIGWAEYGDGIFVAKYPELEKNISVTVDGKETKYAYGDLVTCTANAPDGKVFMYWTKDGEVITTDETYKFNVWKNCTVEAVYGDSAPTLSKAMRKIVVSSFGAGDDSVVMAEFIGLSDALEKGIMFGAKRVAMTSDKTQFAVVDDVDGEICGYAIIKENGELKIITDGKLSE